MRLVVLFLSFISCLTVAFANGTGPNLDEIENYIRNNKSTEVADVVVSIETPGSFNLMWSDPGYLEGPCVIDTNDFYVVSYTTTTYNDDSTVKYSDKWKYYFPSNGEKYCYRYNRYSGKGYHGGSLIYLFGDETLKKNNLQKVLCHNWDSFEVGLFNIVLNSK